MSEADKIDIVYIILNRCGVFKDSLKKWNKKTDADKTYSNMKTFFLDEHLALDQVDALAKNESTLNQIDFMNKQEEVLENMEARLKLNLVEAISEFADKFNDASTLPSNDDNKENEDNSALSTITGQTSKKQNDPFMKMFEALCKKVDRIEAKCERVPLNDGDNNDNAKINPRTGRPFRRYCWSCGCCDHWGRNCPVRKQGHKINATFRNRMGGSTQGVLGA